MGRGFDLPSSGANVLFPTSFAIFFVAVLSPAGCSCPAGGRGRFHRAGRLRVLRLVDYRASHCWPSSPWRTPCSPRRSTGPRRGGPQGRPRRRLVFDLGLLAAFKYFDFFVVSATNVFPSSGCSQPPAGHPRPADGISFLIFPHHLLCGRRYSRHPRAGVAARRRRLNVAFFRTFWRAPSPAPLRFLAAAAQAARPGRIDAIGPSF